MQSNTPASQPEQDTLPVTTSPTTAPEVKYECGICTERYCTEAIARAHISLSEDDRHKNLNGFMPESNVHVIDSDGEQTETRTSRPRDWNLQQYEVSNIPDQYTIAEQVILTAAIRNHVNHTIQDITDTANTLVETHTDTGTGSETPQSVSYHQTHRAIRRILSPTMNTDTTAEDVDSLSAVTEIQQAIILAKLANPDMTHTSVSDIVNVSKSYPTQVISKYESLIDSLEDKLEGDSLDDRRESMRDLIETELSDSAIQSLRENGYLDAINIPTPSYTPRTDTVESTSSDSADTDGGDSDDSLIADGPATQGILSAAPSDAFENGEQRSNGEHDTVTESDTEAKASESGDRAPGNSDGERSSTPEADSDGDTGSEASAVTDTATETVTDANPAPDVDTSKSPGSVMNCSESTDSMQEEIEQLRDKVLFFRDVYEQSLYSSDDPDSLDSTVSSSQVSLALAQTLINDIDAILDQSTSKDSQQSASSA